MYYTEVLSRARELELEEEVPPHSEEPHRPCVRLHVAVRRADGVFDLDCLTGPVNQDRWVGSAREANAAKYPLDEAKGRNWMGTRKVKVSQSKTPAQRQAVMFIEEKVPCPCQGACAMTEKDFRVTMSFIHFRRCTTFSGYASNARDVG